MNLAIAAVPSGQPPQAGPLTARARALKERVTSAVTHPWAKVALACAALALAGWKVIESAYSDLTPNGLRPLDHRELRLIQNHVCAMVAFKTLGINSAWIQGAESLALDSDRLYCQMKLNGFAPSVLPHFEKTRCRELTVDSPWNQLVVPLDQLFLYESENRPPFDEFCYDGFCEVRFHYPGNASELPDSHPTPGPGCK